MKVERIATYERFVDLKEQWNTLLFRSDQSYPFLSHQWFDAWWQCFGQDHILEILFFRDESDLPVGIAPMMIGDGVLQFIASCEVTDYCDFILSADNRNEFWIGLFDYFRKNHAKFSRIEFINIPESSLTLLDMPRLAVEHGFLCEVKKSEKVPVLTLPDSHDKYLQRIGRKNRHELRRKIRKLEGLGDVHLERISESEKLSSAIQEFISLHRESGSDKQEFWRKRGMPEFFDKLTALFVLESWVELIMLYAEKNLIAALLSFPFGDTLYFYNVAYNKEYSPFSPGFFLFDRSIRQAISERKQVADFLRGGEKYKYFFGAEDSKICNLKLFLPKDKQ
jgi:CelD/BcsL family acetyltransferase involved in cellulose biosynthesis